MSSKGRKLAINIGKFRKKFEFGESHPADTRHQSQVSPGTYEISSPILDFASPWDSEQVTTFGMKTSPTGRRVMKSSSLGSIGDGGGQHIVDQDDIIGLTQDVKGFSDGLACLKAVFNDCDGSGDDIRVLAHERLGEVLCVLKNILQHYPALNTTEVFSAAGNMITKIKNYDYENGADDGTEQTFFDVIDQVALAFSSSVSEYLMGDVENNFEETEPKTKSYDNLVALQKDIHLEEETEESKNEVVRLTSEEIDSVLLRVQAGMDLALQRAKAWSKYIKDIISYMERKAALESEYAKSVARLAHSVKPGLREEGFLPLQSVYCTVLAQDIDYSTVCQTTQALLQTSKFVEPLTIRRTEHDKVRKVVKESWVKELKKMQDAVQSLRKAQSLYLTRQHEYEKAREVSQKSESESLSQSSGNISKKDDKRKKTEEDAMHKAAEAETTYKGCVAEANHRQQELLNTKGDLLTKIREQVFLCDQVMKSVTMEYFHLLQNVSAPIPVQFHTLCETTKQYEPGSQFEEFVRRLPMDTMGLIMTEPFLFEPYTPASSREPSSRKVSTQSNGSTTSDHPSQEGSPQTTPRKDKYRMPMKAWSQGFFLGSDTDSASGSSKSLDSSPSNSPHPVGRRKMHASGSLDELVEGDNSNEVEEEIVAVPMAKQLLSIPGGESMDVQGILKRSGHRRGTTFGVDFQEQVEQWKSAVPPIITKCLAEVERRGITFKGIYRVSGVKSKVESLCQRFEGDPESLDLSEQHPNVISNVLKLYLRQLPEPLMTFKLYPRFIEISKDKMAGFYSREEAVGKLGDLIRQLPFSNFKTCGVLMHHLHRVCSFCEINQMTASNLGIVFGPTLLRPLEGTASLASLVDTPHQTCAVELLISYAQVLFGPNDDHELIHSETPVEVLPQDQVDKSAPTASPKVSDAVKDVPRPKPESVKPAVSSAQTLSEVPVDRLIQSTPHGSETTEPKSSAEDFLLPGSAQCDRKDTNSQTAAPPSSIEGEESGDIDLQSDDDMIDTLLPDDSAVARKPQPSALCPKHDKGICWAPSSMQK